jgi:hypothetical protein
MLNSGTSSCATMLASRPLPRSTHPPRSQLDLSGPTRCEPEGLPAPRAVPPRKNEPGKNEPGGHRTPGQILRIVSIINSEAIAEKTTTTRCIHDLSEQDSNALHVCGVESRRLNVCGPCPQNRRPAGIAVRKRPVFGARSTIMGSRET